MIRARHSFAPCYQISRMLAAKASLAIRVDALGEDGNNEMGIEHRAHLEMRLKEMEEGFVSDVSLLVCSHRVYDELVSVMTPELLDILQWRLHDLMSLRNSAVL